MGKQSDPQAAPSIILTATDRLISVNADGGMPVTVAHVILLGELAGRNIAVNGVIALGQNAFLGGVTGISDVALAGSVVIGQNAMTANIDTSVSGLAIANVAIGLDAMRNVSGGAGANVAIGAQVMANGVGGGGSNYSSNVVIGAQAAQQVTFLNGKPFDNNVIMGTRAARGISLVGGQSVLGCVIIGQGACENFPGNLNNNTIIGEQAAPQLAGDNNVAVGINAASIATTGANNVYMGNGGGWRAGSFNVVIGSGSAVTDGDANTILGARIAAITSTSNNVIIGNQAGVFSGLTNLNNQFLLDSTGQPLIYGRFDRGNVLLGGAVAAERAAIAAINPQNVLFLTNGARGGAGAITNGGFGYALAGELNWASPTGNFQLTGIYTVATLTAVGAGKRAFVTDALAPAFGAIVAGGGAVFTPVYSDGAAWLVG